MPITKDGSGTVTETPSADLDQFLRTGVHRADQFALCDKNDRLKQIQFDLTSANSQSIVKLLAGVSSGTINLTLPTTSGTLALTGGSGGNSFSTIQPDAGTSPTASSSSDTLTLTSSDSSITVTGNSATKTINFQGVQANLTGDVTSTGTTTTVAKIAGTAVGTPTGTGNVVFSASPTLTGTIAGASQTLSGTLVATGAISGSNLTSAGHASADLSLAGGTLTGTLTSNVTPAASTPGVLVSGTPYVAGTATTNKPAVLLEESGATSTAWSTAGTYLGVNAKSTFTGNLLDAQVNGVQRLKVDYHGDLTVRGDTVNAASTINLIKPSTGAAGFQLQYYETGNVFNITDGGVPFFNYNRASGFINLTYSSPNPQYSVETSVSSADTNPALQSPGGVAHIPPTLTVRNTNSTVGNFEGIQFAGNSKNLNGALYCFNDTQTASSEDSHIELWNAKAGTFAKKLSIDKNGQLAVQQAGTGLSIKEGSNCKQGTAVLVAGTVTVSNTSITASSRVFLTHQNTGGTVGVPSLGTVVAGTSFVINSSNAADTSTIAYFITEPS